MANEAQTPQADTETITRPALLKSNVNEFIARYSGGVNSPNLPVGQWDFVLNDDATDVFIETLTAKNADGSAKQRNGQDVTYDVAYVTPKGNPDGTKRRVYASAFTAKGKDLLFDKATGSLKSGATFGVFSAEKDGVRTTVVSSNADDVAKGIAAANAAYAVARKLKEEAEAAG